VLPSSYTDVRQRKQGTAYRNKHKKKISLKKKAQKEDFPQKKSTKRRLSGKYLKIIKHPRCGNWKV
jgi:hypothetical protein